MSEDKEDKIDLIMHDMGKLIDVMTAHERRLNAIQKSLDLQDDNMQILEEIKAELTKHNSLLQSLRTHQEKAIKDVNANLEVVQEDVEKVADKIEEHNPQKSTKTKIIEKVKSMVGR